VDIGRGAIGDPIDHRDLGAEEVAIAPGVAVEKDPKARTGLGTEGEREQGKGDGKQAGKTDHGEILSVGPEVGKWPRTGVVVSTFHGCSRLRMYSQTFAPRLRAIIAPC
jgi:hypothetical protein